MERGPRRFSKTELKKVGVTLEDENSMLLRCDNCGQGWVVMNPGRDHPLARGYWKCPYSRCNDPAAHPIA